VKASILKSERGATAIEYAIIAALIGIGLIASLVSTRGSLSSIFGVASSQMGSANGTAPSGGATAGGNPVTSQRAVADPQSSPRAPFWNAKTLVSKVVTNPNATSQVTTFTYADGASASYLAQFNSSGQLTGETMTVYPIGDSGRTMDSAAITYAPDGTAQTLTYIDRYANGATRQIVTGAAPNFSAETVKNYDTNGNLTGTFAYNDPNIGTALTRQANDLTYFRGLSQ
jgi:pilus assembly protein Flp/PilA